MPPVSVDFGLSVSRCASNINHRWRSVEHLRVDLVRGISAYHMLDSYVAAGVKFDPRIQFEYFAVDDDNQVVISNHVFNLTSRQDIVPGPGWNGHLARFDEWQKNGILIFPDFKIQDQGTALI